MKMSSIKHILKRRDKSISDNYQVLWSLYKSVHSYVTLKLEMHSKLCREEKYLNSNGSAGRGSFLPTDTWSKKGFVFLSVVAIC